MKPYISIDEQISLLESRNVLINNYHFAYRVLEYDNYYCVVNGYYQSELSGAGSAYPSGFCRYPKAQLQFI